MKKLIIAVAAVLVSAATYAQGVVQLNNRILPDLDAKVTLPGGTVGVDDTFKAQLVLIGAGGAITPLTPIATFRGGTAAGYVTGTSAVDVTVPGIQAGSQATLALRAFNGTTYETSTMFGQSSSVTVTLGGQPPTGAPLTPAALTGLTGFSVVPEPSTIALAVLGGAALLLRRRK
jgi:hypothetical protein